MEDKYLLGDLLLAKGYTLSAAESLTGGGFGYTITSHPGASAYFKGTLVTYVNDIKMRLGVKQETLKAYGAVSKETASEMVKEAADFFKTEVAISFTGNAGPTALEGKPVGLVYIGIFLNGSVQVFENVFTGGRKQIREDSIAFGIRMLTKLLS
ncbi:MAG: CinA family protein [Bacilli bacterium]|jgi:PncC family amidohydrolase|nr:CinA family protein [Bacilli bacterium]